MFSSEYWKKIKNNYFEEHLRTAVSNYLKSATEQRWAVASVFTLLLSSDNLLTDHEQSSYYQFNLNLSACALLPKDWFILHKKFNQD